jgi:hypothetical protein
MLATKVETPEKPLGSASEISLHAWPRAEPLSLDLKRQCGATVKERTVKGNAFPGFEFPVRIYRLGALPELAYS